MVDTYCASYKRPPATVTLDIDDTLDVVHGHQQMSLFNEERHHVATATTVDEPCDLDHVPVMFYRSTRDRPEYGGFIGH
jgi:hypothetical protein